MTHGKITETLAHICKDKCPVCNKARNDGEGLVYNFVKLESQLCPACRSYKKVYGKPSYMKVDDSE